MVRINKTNKATPVLADTVLIYDSENNTDDKSISLEQVAEVAFDNVNSISGQYLTDNNLTNTLKSNYDTAYTNNHTHSNKTLLDNITSSGDGTQYLSNDGTYNEINIIDTVNPDKVTLTAGTTNTLEEGKWHTLLNGSSTTTINMFSVSDGDKTSISFVRFTTSSTSQPSFSGCTFDYTPVWDTSKSNLVTIFTDNNGSNYAANHRVLGY